MCSAARRERHLARIGRRFVAERKLAFIFAQFSDGTAAGQKPQPRYFTPNTDAKMSHRPRKIAAAALPVGHTHGSDGAGGSWRQKV